MLGRRRVAGRVARDRSEAVAGGSKLAAAQATGEPEAVAPGDPTVGEAAADRLAAPQVTPSPSCLTQPAVPAFCTNLPSAARSKTAAALPVTYTLEPSGLIATRFASSRPCPGTRAAAGCGDAADLRQRHVRGTTKHRNRAVTQRRHVDVPAIRTHRHRAGTSQRGRRRAQADGAADAPARPGFCVNSLIVAA
jgi:hypothetical protein